jgi:pumilio family protein 6
MDALLKMLVSSHPSEDPALPHPIDLPHTSRMYKTFLQGGHFSHETNSISPSPSFSASTFASAFLEVVGKDETLRMAKGNGAFVIAELCERIRAEGTTEERAKLKGWFEDVLKEIEESDAKGKKLLLEKVSIL